MNFGNSRGFFSSGSSSLSFGNQEGTATIDGRTYTGHKIEVRDGGIWVDGVKQDVVDDDGNTIFYRPVTIEVTGNVESIDATSGNVEVSGAARRVNTVSGSVHVGGDCLGKCGTNSGSIRIDGNYECSRQPTTVSGSVSIRKKNQVGGRKIKKESVQRTNSSCREDNF